jgi:hypothetical protein
MFHHILTGNVHLFLREIVGSLCGARLRAIFTARRGSAAMTPKEIPLDAELMSEKCPLVRLMFW